MTNMWSSPLCDSQGLGRSQPGGQGLVDVRCRDMHLIVTRACSPALPPSLPPSLLINFIPSILRQSLSPEPRTL